MGVCLSNCMCALYANYTLNFLKKETKSNTQKNYISKKKKKPKTIISKSPFKSDMVNKT